MSFWDVFLLLNQLLWPVYLGLIALWLIALAIIDLTDRRKHQ